MDFFAMDFWLFSICFINVLSKVITNFKFYSALSKKTLESIFI
jgi:hypothetical protein